jgi:uncharacterized protein
MWRSVDGTFLNAVVVLVGTAAGVLLGRRLPERVRRTMLDGLGIITLVIGIGYAVASKNVLIPLGCLLLGSIVGETLSLEDRVERGAERMRRRVLGDHASTSPLEVATPEIAMPELAAPETAAPETARPHSAAEAFLVASLVFCVGPLTILGSLENGLTGRINQLALKAALDGTAALAFASVLGWGVGASIITILVFQGGLSLSAHASGALLSDRMVLELNALGGILMIGIALRILELRKVPVANMLPGLVLVPFVVAIFAR